MIDSSILKSEERAVFALRSLYRKYGYLPFKMSKFEEYEFYIQNKDFLVSDRIIAFNDTNGKLLALKPDVTLSIIKNGEDIEGFKQKVCYNENVYRISENTHQFKEIMQTGVECIGKIDLYDIFEVVSLAAQSLNLIDEDFVLEISHLGLFSSLVDSICDKKSFKQNAMKFLSEKNSHDLEKICDENGVSDKLKEVLLKFVSIYGERNSVLSKVKELSDYVSKEAIEELEMLSKMLDTLPFKDKIRFDFSVVNDTNYYNSIVFKGFLSGVSQSVLTGGQYDKLLKKMNRKSGAIGFAIYLDMLNELDKISVNCDVDVLVLYNDKTEQQNIIKTVNKLIKEKKTVSVQPDITEKIRFGDVIDLRGRGLNA